MSRILILPNEGRVVVEISDSQSMTPTVISELDEIATNVGERGLVVEISCRSTGPVIVSAPSSHGDRSVTCRPR